MLQQGSDLGRYRILRRVGSGGMAITFLCALEGAGGFQKHVVVKMLDPARIDDERYVHMFLDEARLWAKLNHPNIPQAFELSDFHGVPYIVMEYVPGPTLYGVARRITERPPRVLWLISRIGAEVARALDYAHYGVDSSGTPHRVIHRDVTPSNVLVSTNGQAKLIDFGIALADDRLAKTDVGILKGRLQYMAPEQLLDKPVDHRTDIFQLGVTLYHMLTGRTPFVGANKSTASVWKTRMEGQFTPIQVAYPECPDELAEIVHRCLEAQPSRRYNRGNELAEALSGYANADGPLEQTHVAAWIAQLFPNQEWNSSPDPQTTTSAGSIQRLTTGGTRTNTAITLESQPVFRAGTIALATLVTGIVLSASLFVGVGVLIVGLRLTAPPPSDPVPRTAEVDPNRAARVYLDEAERLVAANRHADATSFLLKAREANPTDPDVVVRLMRIGSLTEEYLLLATARRALEDGDLDAAAARAREILDRQPSHEEALSILARVSDLNEAKESKGERRPAARAKGRLAVVAHPPARVFVDDRPYGTTPIDAISLAVGTHTVDLRLAGHEAVKKVVTIRENEEFSLDVALQSSAPAVEPSGADATRISSLIDEAAGRPSEPAPVEAAIAAPAPAPAPSPKPIVPAPTAPAPVEVAQVEKIQPPAPGAGTPRPVMTADVPLAQQALVLARALAFDTKLKSRAGEKLVVASLFNDPVTKKRSSRMNSEFTSYSVRIQGMTLGAITLEYTSRDDLAAQISSQGVDALYIPTGMGAQVAEIIAAARQANVLTLGAEPSFVQSGVSLGVFNVGGQPQLALNTRAATAEGASFQGEILQLAVVLN